ncbi:phospholipase D-like domain-containing protein [Nocardiopsis coralliicola]
MFGGVGRARGLAAAGAAAVLVAGAVGAASADAGGDALQATEATFNEPGGDANGTEIITELEELIDGAEDGSTIRVAQYRLRDHEITSALERAAVDRGVQVQVLVDHGTRKDGEDDDFARLEAALADDGDDATWVKICDDGPPGGERAGCNGSNAMHNKFFLFSETSGATEVLSTGSYNHSGTGVGGTGGWNSLYTTSGNSGLYERYGAYFGDLEGVADGEQPPDGDYYGSNPPEIYGDTKAYFYPRADGEGRDTYLNSLNEVDCAAQSTTVRVDMWSFTRAPIGQKLRDLAEEGCTVDVVATRIRKGACNAMTSGGLPEGLSIRGFTNQDAGTHQKNLLIDGHYLEDGAKAVFTGSHNWNSLSWQNNDENVLRILGNTAVHDQFAGNFAKVQEAADINVARQSDCPKVLPDEDGAAADDS